MSKYFKKLKNFFKDPLFLRHWESKYDFYSRRKKDNQLAAHITGQAKRKTHSYYGDSHMLIEDMYVGIMPFMHSRGEREKYPVKIHPQSKDQERFIVAGLTNRGYPTFLADAVTDFVRTASHVLFQDGVAFYEIIPDFDKNSKLKGFQIELLQPYYIYKFLNNYYQFVNWREAKATQSRVRIIKIPKDRILRIKLPSQIIKRPSLQKILARMYKLSKEIIPEFQMEAMKENKDIGFDGNKYNNTKYLEIATLTKDFGWNQRKTSTDHTTEYYSMIRFLRSKKTQALVRDEIFKKLNEALNGLILNLDVKLTMENLFTAKDVEIQEQKLKEGNVEFMAIFNATNI